MTQADNHRSLIAGMLSICILWGLFACGSHHAQWDELSLRGLSGLLCSGNGQAPALDPEAASSASAAALLACPLCSSPPVAVSPGGTFAALVDLSTATLPEVARSWAQPPPRYLRSTLNPRASPPRFPAVQTTA